LAWAPCLTPTFSAVYGLAFSQGTAGRGAFLMTCYCLGLGVPFLLVALGVGWVSGVLTFVRRHKRVVSQVGGVLLIVIGVLLVSGLWNHWMDELRSAVGPGAGVGANL
jgi:cytochrome c-type biogenesis protein